MSISSIVGSNSTIIFGVNSIFHNFENPISSFTFCLVCFTECQIYVTF